MNPLNNVPEVPACVFFSNGQMQFDTNGKDTLTAEKCISILGYNNC